MVHNPEAPRGFVLEAALLGVAIMLGIGACASGCSAERLDRRVHDFFDNPQAYGVLMERLSAQSARLTSLFMRYTLPQTAPRTYALEQTPTETRTESELGTAGASEKESAAAPAFSPFSPGSAASNILKIATKNITTPVTSLASAEYEKPIKIIIDGADVSSDVLNPASTDMAVLDEAILHGAARFPTTSLLGENGTMLVFGHSSYRPKIRNPAYRTFDGIEHLSAGSIVHVYSATADYQYTVRGIKRMNADDASANTIPLPDDKPYLVIVTCDTLTSTSSRFVLTADFVKKTAL